MTKPRFLCTVFMPLSLAMPAITQPKATTPKLAVVSGRIFAITQSGDIKPGRMAKVYLLWSYHSLKDALAEEKKGKEEETALDTFFDQWHKARAANLDERQRDAAAKNYWSESLSCHKELGAVDDAVLATLQWCMARNKTNQIPMTDADEEGNFRITGVRPGVYRLVARGRAGFNDAFWSVGFGGQDNVTVAAGMETRLKLSSPEKSCLDEN